MKNKVIRLFISSTFADFMEERDRINRLIVPKMERFCKERGYLFQVVDLRFGVSLDAMMAQDTMKICLEEIKRCQGTKHYPNFMLLIGDRYGWCPLPTMIEVETFEQLILWGQETFLGDIQLLNKWYQLDENQIPPSYILKEKDALAN